MNNLFWFYLYQFKTCIFAHLAGNENGVFRLDVDIDRGEGKLVVAKPLNREDQSVYYLDIQASNGEPDYTVVRNRRRRAVDASIITVKISIGDINDEAPVFLSDEYFGCKFLSPHTLFLDVKLMHLYWNKERDTFVGRCVFCIVFP